MPPLGGLAVVLALGLALWWAWPGAPAGPEAAGAGTAAAGAAPAASDAAPGAAWALLDQASRQADAAEQEANTPWLLCGFGRVQLNPGADQGQPTPEEIRLKQWDQDALNGPLMQRLATSGRLVDRVTAAVLQRDPDRAAELARQGQDPRAYALAFSQCGAGRGPGCASLSAADWAAREPDNAAPWWHVAVQALRRGDAGAVHQALRHAEAATRALDSRGLMMSSLKAAEPEQATPLVLAAISMEFPIVMAWTEVLGRDCTMEAYRQGPLREACQAVADQLIRRAPGLMTRVAVSAAGRRARLANMPDEAGQERLKAAWRFSEAQRLAGDLRTRDIGCAVTRAILTWETGLAAHGEAEAVRQAGGPAF